MQRYASSLALVLVALISNPCASPAHGQSLSLTTATPIKHLVVIFDENISFDHYFGTYPNAANPQDEPAFKAAPGTPEVNGLTGTCSAPQSQYRSRRSASIAAGM